ncbi:MAG: hypothetical protein RI988_3723, partial [Pseudomonadota bacterium]
MSAGPPGPGAIFVAFNQLALQGFGGVLAVAQRELVEKRAWMSKEEFLELLSIGQVLPGPNIVNMALIYGDRCCGWRGAAAALGGVMGVPLLIVLALAWLWQQGATSPLAAGALRGMSLVAAGLIVATALRLVGTLGRNVMGPVAGGAVIAMTILAIGVLRWPLVAVLPVLGLVGW